VGKGGKLLGVGLLGLLLAASVEGQKKCDWLLGLEYPPICRDVGGVFTPPNPDEVVGDYRLFEADTGVKATWPDTSGLSNDISETTVGQRPTTTGAAHPSDPGFGLKFDEPDDEMNEGGPTLTLGKRAFAIAWDMFPTGDTFGIVAGSDSTSQQLLLKVGAIWRWAGSSGAQDDFASWSSGYHYVLIYEDYDADTLEIWYDGVKVTDSSAWTLPAANVAMRVGNSGIPIARDMYKMIVWESSSALTWSAGDLTSLWAYLDNSFILLFGFGLRRRLKQIVNDNKEIKCLAA